MSYVSNLKQKISSNNDKSKLSLSKNHITVEVNQKKITDNQSQNFKPKISYRDKNKLKNLLLKIQQEEYQKNPLVQRRLQQKFAQKAQEVYGIDAKKMMGAIHDLSAKDSQSLDWQKNLISKVNGKK